MSYIVTPPRQTSESCRPDRPQFRDYHPRCDRWEKTLKPLVAKERVSLDAVQLACRLSLIFGLMALAFWAGGL